MSTDITKLVSTQDDPTLTEHAKLYTAIYRSEFNHALSILTGKEAEGQDLACASSDAHDEKIAELYATLGARLRVVEELLTAGESLPRGPYLQNHDLRIAQKEDAKPLEIPVEELGDVPNLLSAESDAQGTRIRWTSGEPATSFSFEADRSLDATLSVGVAAIVKPKYIKKLRLFVDGVHQPHKVRAEGGYISLDCKVPAQTEKNSVELLIELPATHRPIDVSESGDIRHIGIALISFSLRPRKSWFARGIKK